MAHSAADRRSIEPLDGEQLRRIEASIARIEGAPASEQAKLSCLLDALRQQRADLLRRHVWRGPASDTSAPVRGKAEFDHKPAKRWRTIRRHGYSVRVPVFK